MPDKISPSQFAAKIKQKYPTYNGMDDSTLVAKVVEKYPQYKDSIDFGIKPTQGKPVAVPSFREFAASKGLSLEKQRQMAEGTYGPDLAMKAKQDIEVAEAPERRRTKSIIEASRREEALVNTTKKKLDGKGVKYTDYDPLFKTELEKTRKDVQDGALVLTEDNTRKPVYKPALGFFESLGYAFKNSVDESVAAAKFDVADSRGKQKIAEEEMRKEAEAVPTGVGGKIGEVLGGAAPLIAQAEVGASIGTAVAPGAGTIAGIIGSVLATLPDAFSKGRKTEAIRRYNQEVEEIKRLKGSVTQEEKDQAMNKAMSVGNVAGIAEGAVMAGLSFIAPGSRAAGRGLMNAIKNEAKHAAYDVTRQVGLGIGAEVAKGTAAKIAGYNVSAADIIEDAVRRGGSDAEMALSFALYHNVKNTPKYVQSAAKNYLSTLPRPELNNLSSVLEGNGVIPKGATEKMNADLDAFNEAKKEFAGMVPEEDMGVFAGLALKKKNLEEKIKSTTLAPVRERLQEELAAVEGRIGKMMESKNPVSEEVNDLSGDTGEGEPITEERLQETVKNFSEPKPTDRTPGMERLTPTISIEGREYTGADHGEAMRKAIESGEDVPSPDTPEGDAWRTENGLFKDNSTGELLTRDESSAKYGVARSQELGKSIEEVVPIPEAKPLTRTQIKQELSRIDMPTDAYGIALKALAEGAKVNYESFKAMTGGKSEAYSSGFTAEKAEKAPSVEKLAEQLWWDYVPEEQKPFITDMEIRDALIDVMNRYKNKTEAGKVFVESYSPEVLAEQAQYIAMQKDDVVFLEDTAYSLKQWENWMKEIGEVEESLKLSDEYIKSLIEDEQQLAAARETVATTEPAKPIEAPVSDVGIKETGEAVGEFAKRQGTNEEILDFTRYSEEQLSRPEFDGEYRNERIPGETREQFLLRKYCK